MLILVPWKPVVIAWSLLAAMLWVGYIGYSVLERKNPFAMAQHHSSRVQTRSTAGHDPLAKSNSK
jgi:hypothetical protein